MPVEFACQQCQNLLKVTRRKIGSQVACPKCAQLTLVPDKQAAAVGVAMARAARTQAPAVAIPELVVYDDVPELIARESNWPGAHAPVAGSGAVSPSAVSPSSAPPSGAPSATSLGQLPGPHATRAPATLASKQAPAHVNWGPAPAGSAPEARPRPAPHGTTGTSAPSAAASHAAWTAPTAAAGWQARAGSRASAHAETPMLLISRQAIYVQGLLFMALGLVVFVLGFLIGRGHGLGPLESDGKQAKGNPVVLQGSLVYLRAPGQLEGDEDAVAIAIPTDARPEALISTQGLSPQTAMNLETSPGLNAIASLGGDYARADITGSFQLVVPKEGDYHLLLLSRHALRPGGERVDPATMRDLGALFESPAELLGLTKYDWSVQHLAAGSANFTHEFGMSGR